MDQISSAVIVGFVLSLGSTVLCVAWGLSRWNRRAVAEEPAREVAQWASSEEAKSKIA